MNADARYHHHLPPEQQYALLKAAQNGDFSAREQLAQANLPLVHSMAARFKGIRDTDDLFQVGCIGLLKAIDRFDPDRGLCFSTYAVPLILGEIRRFLRDDRLLRISRSLQERAYLIQKCRRDYQRELGKEPELKDLCRITGLSAEIVITAMDSQRPLISISDLLRREQPADHNEDRIPELSEDRTEETNERLNMARMLDELPERLSYILRGRYFEEKTQTALAKELQVSQVQISRLEKKALSLIRDKLET